MAPKVNKGHKQWPYYLKKKLFLLFMLLIDWRNKCRWTLWKNKVWLIQRRHFPCFNLNLRSYGQLFVLVFPNPKKHHIICQIRSNIHSKKLSWHGYTENGHRWSIAQLWKLFLYITNRILKISFRNCVSSLLSTHYMAFLLQAHSIWQKPRAFNSTQTPKLTCLEYFFIISSHWNPS